MTRNTHYCDCAECRELLEKEKKAFGKSHLIILGVVILLAGLGIFLFSRWS